MAVPVKVAPMMQSDVLKSEMELRYCRENAVFASGNVYPLGLQLGRVRVDTTAANTVVAITPGNTGNGALTKAAGPVVAGARPGVYTVSLTAPTAFDVIDPEGDVIGTGATGVAYSREVAFTLAAGGTAFVAGDSFTITVPEPAVRNRYVPLAATRQADGSHLWAGTVLTARDATLADQPGVILANGPAEVAVTALVWPAAFTTDAQKAPALAAMRAALIKPFATA